MDLSSIKEMERQSLRLHRSELRQEILGKSRDGVPQQVVNWDVEVDKAIASLAAEPTPSLTTLKKSFLVSEKHIVTFLRHKSALHTLIGCLTSLDSYVQLSAVEACCNLSLGDSKSCAILAKGAGVYLVNIANSSNQNIIPAALCTLANLCAGGEFVCRLLQGQGVLESLTRLISDSSHREEACKALIQFTHRWPYIDEESRLEVIRRAEPFLETSRNSRWLVSQVVAGWSCDRLQQFNLPQRSAALLSSPEIASDLMSAAALIRLIANLSPEILPVSILPTVHKGLRRELEWALERYRAATM